MLLRFLFFALFALNAQSKSSLEREAQSVLDNLVDALTPIQKETGEWLGPLEADPSVDVLPVFLTHRLGLKHAGLKEETLHRFFAWQDQKTGTWSSYPGGPPSVDVTGMILHGLRILLTETEFKKNAKVQLAVNWYEKNGGDKKLNVLNKMLLVFSKLLPGTKVPPIQARIVALPSWVPFNIHRIGFGRTGLIPLGVFNFYRNAHKKKDIASLDPERRTSAGALFGQSARGRDNEFWAQESIGWLLSHQHQDGTWAGAIQITYFSMLALYEAQLAGVGDFTKEINLAWKGLMDWRVRLPNNQMTQLSTIGPVMDTARTLTALPSVKEAREGQVKGRERALAWLLEQQTKRLGDWQFGSPGVEPGGWAFEYFNDLYPDLDDTAMAIEAIASEKSERLKEESKTAIQKGVRWMLGLQNKDGGFPTWDKDNSKLFSFLTSKGIGGMAEVADDGQGDITSRVLRSYAEVFKNVPEYIDHDLKFQIQGSIQKACKFLDKKKIKVKNVPLPVWRGEWMVNYLYGTSEAISSMLKVGCLTHKDVKPHIDWIISKQNSDGGFGEDQVSYIVKHYVGAPSTLTQTQFVLNALIEYEKHNLINGRKLPSVRDSIDRALKWMITKMDGNKYPTEEEFTGVFVRKVWYARYWMLPHYEGIRVLRDWLRLLSDEI